MYFEIHRESTNTDYGQNAEFLNVQVGHTCSYHCALEFNAFVVMVSHNVCTL